MRLFSSLSLAVFVVAVQASAQEPVPAAVDVAQLSLGPELDRAQVGSRLYVALASGGVAIVDVSQPVAPKLVGRFAEGQRIERLFVSGDTLFVVQTRHELVAWSLARPDQPRLAVVTPSQLPEQGGAASAPVPMEPVAFPAPLPEPRSSTVSPVPMSRAQESQAPVTAKVVAVRDGRVVFDAGTATGFKAGDRVRIISQRLESKPDLTTGETVKVPSGAVSAVVEIEHAEAEKAMARLGRGDSAEPGDLVMRTHEPLSESLLLPRRAPFRFLGGFHARPFLGVGGSTRDGGLLADVYGTIYLENLPLSLSLAASPVGFAIGSSEAHFPASFAFTVAYATDYFEIGLGAGALIGNVGPCYTDTGLVACEENNGPTVNQMLRLGALDGINVVWRSSIFARPDAFVFGVGRGEINIPLTRQLGVFGAGGAGENGWGFGEFGVRSYLGGAGARGTTILSASLGYGAVFDGPNHENVGGPLVAFGMEWRL